MREEIRTPPFGMGLDHLLRTRSDTVFGILNGIDTDAWDPQTDTALPQTYGANTVHLRRANREKLLESLQSRPHQRTAVRRRQPPDLAEGHGHAARLCGPTSSPAAANCVCSAPAKPSSGACISRRRGACGTRARSALITGYNESLSHLIQGGADLMVVPSRFEPCGLTQLYGLRYGCVPLVARTGGLADTVIDANSGRPSRRAWPPVIQFTPRRASRRLRSAIRRTVELYRDEKTWKTDAAARHEVRTCRGRRSARRYANLYRDLLGITP